MKSIARKMATLAATTAVAVSALLAAGPSASAADVSQNLVLSTPDWWCGQSMSSSSMQLVFQCDGNLVLYRLSDHHPMWASGTTENTGFGLSDPNLLNFSHDGYWKLISTHSWGSNTVCIVGDASAAGGRLTLQDDGNLVMYTSDGRAVWDTGTYGGRQGTLHECR